MKSKNIKTFIVSLALCFLLVLGITFSKSSNSGVSPLSSDSYFKLISVSATDYQDKKNVRLGGCKPKANWICDTGSCDCE